MFIIHKGRAEGKTTDLVRWVKEGKDTKSYPFWSRVILVHSLQEAQRMRKKGNEYGLDYTQVYSYQEWANAYKGLLPVEVGIDNADILLQSLFGIHPVKVVSITQEG